MNSEKPVTTHKQYVTTTNEDTSIIKFIDQILSEAISKQASDIHFEPYNEHYRIRFRIDGLLYEGQVYVADGIFAMTIIDITGGDIGLHNAIKYLLGEDIGPKTFFKSAVQLDKNGKVTLEIPDSVKE